MTYGFFKKTQRQAGTEFEPYVETEGIPEMFRPRVYRGGVVLA